MAEETVNQGTNQTAGQTQTERTFTQAEVDAMIGERLSRERAKYADYEQIKAKADQYTAQEEAAKSDLQKALDKAAKLQSELDGLKKSNAARDARDKVSAETGVPASLLTGETEEACKAQADAILKWRGDKPKYPTTADGGETNTSSGGKTRDQFAEWAEAALSK